MMASLVRPIALMKSGTGGAMGGARAVEDVFEREVQRVRLMDRDFKNPRCDLHRTGEAPGGGEKDAEARRIDAASLRNFGQHGRRRCLVAFDHQGGLRKVVDVAEFFIQLFDARQARAGPEPSAKKPDASSLMVQPAYWLARQAMTGIVECTTTPSGQLRAQKIG